MARLSIIGSKGEKKYYPLRASVTIIGRSPDNDIVISDPKISRHHARFNLVDSNVYIVDLGSSNGTFVNRLLVKDKKLVDKDEMLLGSTRMIFEEVSAEEVSLAEEDKLSKEGAVVKGLGEGVAIGEVRAPEISEVEEMKRRYQNLLRLYEIGKELTAAADLNALLNLIMDSVFKTINADRGFLMLIDPKTNELIPRIVKHREPGRTKESKLTLSKTIANKVISEKASILTSDAQDDERFKEGESIFMQDIHSVICAPLWKEEDVIGVIYLDSFSLQTKFTENDLDLLTAIGNLAAVGIEKERLNEKVRNETQIRANLERFHSPDVANYIIKRGKLSTDTLLNVENVDATILFSDIKGFTSLSENLEPAEVAMMLNEYFSIMTDIIFKYEGTLDKYIGDAIMAVFGAPLWHEDHAKKAVEAAIDMQKELRRLIINKPAEKKFEIKIGINTGNVVAGSIGSTKRLEYTVLGDVVNTAERIESITEPGQILIGEKTYQMIKGLFKTKLVGVRRVKGREKSIEVYEVLGYK